MADKPVTLQRPVIVLAGLYDPGIVSGYIAEKVREISTTPSRVIDVSFLEQRSFDECANKLVLAVQRAFPSRDPTQTIEVDVIGFSMGGLVARYAALPAKHRGSSVSQRPQLRIKRLFTISTPHRGAGLAWLPSKDRRVLDMRSTSAFLAKLNGNADSYPIVPYVMLGDLIVGTQNASPPGQEPLWVAGPFGLSHITAGFDVRILTDIARYLRGEPAFTIMPAGAMLQERMALGLP